MTWGDVLCAAICACSAAGSDKEVSPKDLPAMVAKILAKTGDAKSVYRTTGDKP